MSYIATIPAEEAQGEVLELYARQQGSKSYLPNYANVFCYRPGVMKAWAKMQEEIRSTVDFRRYELITLVAALELKMSYCALAHGEVLTRKFYSEEQLTAIVADSDNAELSEKERAMIQLARKVVRDTSTISSEDINTVRNQGFSEEEIFDIIAVAAARCFFAKIPDALGVQPDARFQSVPDKLRRLLVVGRGIAEEADKG